MRNLHKFYYKDYFSLEVVSINNVNRHIDYELLLDDTKKKQLESEIKQLKEQEKNLHGYQKEKLKNEISELNAQLSVNVDVLKVRNKVLTGYGFVKRDQQGNPTRELLDNAYITNEFSADDDNNHFPLEIQYPGLVTGIGIDHEAKIEGEFKLGVHFDWTFGMPIVYGSSVKGVLRSWFMEIYLHGDGNYFEKCGKIDAGDLMMEIFEGVYERDIEAEKKKYINNWEEKVLIPENRIYKNHKSIYQRDIFFDAVIKQADKKGRILCSDSITPHGDNPLKNPTPLTFLKIAPGCTLDFRFKLQDSDFGEGKIFTASQKKSLFEEILKTVGIGAKTNVGYGQLKSEE